MATFTWTPVNPNITNSWILAANWTPGAVPASADTATITLAATGGLLGENRTIDTLFISGGTLGNGSQTTHEILTALTAEVQGGINIVGTLNATVADFTNSTTLNAGAAKVQGLATIGNTAAGTVILSSAGTLTSATLTLGGSAGIAGLLNAANGGFNISGQTNLGVSGSGALTVDVLGDGVIGGAAVVGLNAGASGTITVINGSKLTVGGAASLGVSGAANVTVDQSASLIIAGALTAGVNAGSSATIDINNSAILRDGADVTIGTATLIAENSGQLSVVNGGTGSNRVFINAGGRVTAQTSGIITANAIVMADGGVLTVQSSGQTTLTGATDTPLASGLIALAVNGTATVNNGRVASTEQLLVGDNPGAGGTGLLAISAGGNVSDSFAIIGYNAGNHGTVTVSGSGSNLTNSNSAGTAGGMIVGRAGVGTLSVQSGGVVSDTLDSVIGSLSGSAGTALVDGTSSIWGVQGTLTVGDAGAGALTVGVVSGGAINSTGLVVGNSVGGSGTVVVGHNGRWSDTGGLVVGEAGTGSLEIDTSPGFNVANDIVVGDAASGVGTINITTSLSTFHGAAGIVVGKAGTGTFLLGTGAAVSSPGNVDIGVAAGSRGTLQVNNGSLTVTSADLRAGIAGTAIVNIGTGAIRVSGSLAAGAPGAGIATITLGGGTLQATNITIDTASSLSGRGNITFTGIGDNEGLISAAGGTLKVNGVISGGGTLLVSGGAELDLGSSVAPTDKIVFQSSASAEVLGLSAPNAIASVIQGFRANATIDLLTVAHTLSQTYTYNAPSHLLTVSDNSITQATLTLDSGNPFLTFNLNAAGGGTAITGAACYAAGTRIATVRGEVPVERLRAGDVILLARGGIAPVVWLGWRHLDCRNHRRPQDVMPVRIRAGAFGAGAFGESLPLRDLILSPDHAVFTHGALVPIRYLLNGSTIVQETVPRISYYHVELPVHDVILADGLPAESFLDTGNRSAFANGSADIMLHPDFARAVWAAKACASLVIEGPHLAATKARLLVQAGRLGYSLTREPALRVLANGKALAAERDGQRWSVRLPPTHESVRFESRRWVPAYAHSAESDTRTLGVALRDLRLDGRSIRLDDPLLAAGWAAPEPEWRWTDGDAGLTWRTGGRLTFEVAMTGSYWVNTRSECEGKARVFRPINHPGTLPRAPSQARRTTKNG